ncbi:TMV resistance protein N-like [Pyrus ussuriensis x Pyrus communis]|uniref:TMV resistance protein N-like n=1 Tax=Pyrus ussuriensis x Pyrus communis TaxID=2448454 RepID=A0A5N5F8B3_9ROSA|nr:TMV resistance protein N-like [Pyrus ussuriensis x Pyrus communis]
MVGRHGRCGGRQACQYSPHRERHLRDIEMDDLRRQVQQLQQRLERYEPLEHDDPRHETKNDGSDEEEENPFGGGDD